MTQTKKTPKYARLKKKEETCVEYIGVIARKYGMCRCQKLSDSMNLNTEYVSNMAIAKSLEIKISLFGS